MKRPSTAPYLLKPLAASQGITVRELVIEAVRNTGSIAAAARLLRCNSNTVRHHLKAAGYSLEQYAELVKSDVQS